MRGIPETMKDLLTMDDHEGAPEEPRDAEDASTAGDSAMSLLNIGFTASVKIWSSEDMVEVEGFCDFGAEEINKWQEDTRGGMFITAARQFSRAMQGKTWIHEPDNILSDHEHDSQKYIDFVTSKDQRRERVMVTYG